MIKKRNYTKDKRKDFYALIAIAVLHTLSCSFTSFWVAWFVLQHFEVIVEVFSLSPLDNFLFQKAVKNNFASTKNIWGLQGFLPQFSGSWTGRGSNQTNVCTLVSVKLPQVKLTGALRVPDMMWMLNKSGQMALDNSPSSFPKWYSAVCKLWTMAVSALGQASRGDSNCLRTWDCVSYNLICYLWEATELGSEFLHIYLCGE